MPGRKGTVAALVGTDDWAIKIRSVAQQEPRAKAAQSPLSHLKALIRRACSPSRSPHSPPAPNPLPQPGESSGMRTAGSTTKGLLPVTADAGSKNDKRKTLKDKKNCEVW
ncbi:hypothetical protein UY3_01140 [Chelonia mydas]|uniref:Uncharacterized protein n=1 Tax=Chelonia mydas TaxID=8469 RepID=M7C0E6_CHEMY|nr:hypothetical protein UY3_01140 [Chelonia mydas]